MHSAAIYWKVKGLASPDSPFPPQEGQRIINMNSENDRIPLLISLLDEVDFRDNYPKDEHKVISMLKIYRVLSILLIFNRRIVSCFS